MATICKSQCFGERPFSCKYGHLSSLTTSTSISIHDNSAKNILFQALLYSGPKETVEHPIPDLFKMETRQAIYIPLPKYQALITALVVNYISPLKIQDWDNKIETDIRLVPVFDDPSSERGSKATMGMQREFVAQEIEHIKKLLPNLSLPVSSNQTLPMRNLLL